ncbi:MAG TPA: copper resistance protein CopC [Micropepsaceae bacterium]|nr:copper resistance protein CopC [Micropepsaceae bacterium]
MRTSLRRFGLLCIACVVAIPGAQAAGVRDFTRMAPSTVTDAQASELTLTLTDASSRPIQNWIRTAGTVDKTGKVLTAFLRPPESDLVRTGQRTQTYTVNTRTKMTLGYVTRIAKQKDGAAVEVTLTAPVAEGLDHLMEIVVERGPYLSVPNVSIIEEGDQHIVYLANQPGKYTPKPIKTGIQGELYTQVTDGLSEGDQVVSIGSFFVDADNKLKSAGMASMPGMDMPGMDMTGTVQVAANAPAGAAAQAVVTEPAANATVKAPLSMIHVMLPQPVDVKSAGFAATKDGKPIDVGQAMPMGTDGKMLMAMPKTPLAAGRYTVKWHATGTNAKPVQGEFSFTVQ